MKTFRCGHPINRENSYSYTDRRAGRRSTCKTCRKERQEDRKSQRVEVAGRMVSTLASCPHGKTVGYTYYSCRCPDCTTAWSSYMAAYRKDREEAW
jgi:hypothetical protein